jgi:S-adenosylmethionine:tRNA ribosyltransferase-isomerase
MKIQDFDFSLPQELIAQHPLAERDQSRMMVVRRNAGTWEHRSFRDLPDVLEPHHLVVVNRTRVLPARLRGRRPGRRESIEVLLLEEPEPGVWLALVRPGKKLAPGGEIDVGGLRARVAAVTDSGARLLRFDAPEQVRPTMDALGEAPLPPYIRREQGEARDRERYQTMFAAIDGSIAAPTAALHFTPHVVRRLSDRGIQLSSILLHVGYGTFQPLRTDEVERHSMHPEYFEITEETARQLTTSKTSGKQVVAVGTTTTRALEFSAARHGGEIRADSGSCDLFIYPGFRFRAVDALLTNFHLPGSTLLLLVCAFAGRELTLAAYREAIRRRYRFFSYGDCMLIL